MEKGGKEQIEIVVFDLNGTFYNKSSKEEFYKFILKKNPNRLKYVWEMSFYYLQLKFHQIKQTEFKENFFNYLDDIPPAKVEELAREFWEKEFPQEFHGDLLNRFDEFKKKGIPVICATGGFELYVKPLFDIYKISGFAGTQVKYTGETYEVIGKACKDEEKIRRLEKLLDGKSYKIIEAYSDSKEEILDRAEKAFLIKDGKITRYKNEES
jgi:phosphoserine phosphatase